MISKEQVIESMRALPDEFDREELIERLIIIDSYNKGKKQIREQKTKGLSEVQKDFEQWRRSV